MTHLLPQGGQAPQCVLSGVGRKGTGINECGWGKAGNGQHLHSFQLPWPRASPAWKNECFCCYWERFLTFQGPGEFRLSFPECLSLPPYSYCRVTGPFMLYWWPSPTWLRTELATPLSVFSYCLVHTLSVVAHTILHFSFFILVIYSDWAIQRQSLFFKSPLFIISHMLSHSVFTITLRGNRGSGVKYHASLSGKYLAERGLKLGHILYLAQCVAWGVCGECQ